MLSVPMVPDESRDLAELAGQLAVRVRSLVIGDVPAYQGALAALQELRAVMRRIEEQRKEVTRPLLDEKRRLDSWYRAPEQALKSAEEALVEALTRFRAECAAQAEMVAIRAERERQRALEKADEWEAKGQPQRAAHWRAKAGALAAPVAATLPTVPGVSWRTSWKWELLDAAAVPREWLTVDAAKVDEAVRAMGEVAAAAIPGIRVWAEELPVVTLPAQWKEASK
ncbi:MAG: hypothetical protein N2109_07135 [Fimbriimonadales bacterium]|nr:hypothetical protein [Fimbriimonadales bacterium]